MTQVQAQSDLMQNFYIFFKDKQAYNVHQKDVHFQDLSRNLILDHMLLSVAKIDVQMIPKNNDSFSGSSSKNYPFLGSNVLSLNWDQGRL